MKKSIAMAIILIILAISLVYGQRSSGMLLHNEERYNELQALRVYTIIQALKIDAKSEKGVALLDIINRQAEESRKFLLERERLQHSLHDLLKTDAEIDEDAVTDLILKLEDLLATNMENQKRFGEEFKALLTPVERAKLMMADEIFRQRLRNAMQGKRRWQNRDRTPPSNMP